MEKSKTKVKGCEGLDYPFVPCDVCVFRDKPIECERFRKKYELEIVYR